MRTKRSPWDGQVSNRQGFQLWEIFQDISSFCVCRWTTESNKCKSKHVFGKIGANQRIVRHASVFLGRIYLFHVMTKLWMFCSRLAELIKSITSVRQRCCPNGSLPDPSVKAKVCSDFGITVMVPHYKVCWSSIA